MRVDEKIGRGQTIRTEGSFEREKPVTGPGKKASYKMNLPGGPSDISHSIVDGKVKRIGKS